MENVRSLWNIPLLKMKMINDHKWARLVEETTDWLYINIKAYRVTDEVVRNDIRTMWNVVQWVRVGADVHQKCKCFCFVEFNTILWIDLYYTPTTIQWKIKRKTRKRDREKESDKMLLGYHNSQWITPNLFPIKLHNILKICYSIMAVGITFFSNILKCLHEFSIQCEKATI